MIKSAKTVPARRLALRLRESRAIVGCVAMWRPLQIFLYDWWPLQRQIRRYQMLGSAHIQVIQGN